MTLWRFLSKHSDIPLTRVLAIAGVSGLSNAMLLAVINHAAYSVSADGMNIQMFVLFIITIAIYVLSQGYILRVSSIEVEKIIARLRVSLSDKIRQADLQALEHLGRSQIYGVMNNDTLTISQTTTPMILAGQGAILVLFSMGYLFYLSQLAFVLTLVIVGAGVVVHTANKAQLASEMERAAARENEFYDVLTHLIDGFKEVKVNAARGKDLFAHLKEIAGQVATLKTKTAVRYADKYIFSQVLFYLLIGAMVFIVPSITTVEADDIQQITASILFIIGPLSMAISAYPAFRTADHSVQNILRLERELIRAQSSAVAKNGNGAVAPPFETIEMKGIRFSYTDSEGRPAFGVGPLDFTLRRGEIVFIVGGNGSGKSTFLKLLTSLYYPESGTISVDGVDVKAIGAQNYRELYSVIFSDYHLFERLYGTAKVEDRRVYDLLRLMQIDQKTTWADGRFQNTDLSTGQRKRLALIISLLEEKSIYIFDEWAADQDPAFRQFFYESLLPEMKRLGKTIVAATHDDRYFHVGDRTLKMEVGQFVSADEGKANS
jgi:putative ATP-binding cassette transporter